MSRQLNNASNQYLAALIPSLSEPFTLACVASTPDLTVNHQIMSVGDANGLDYHGLRFQGTAVPDRIACNSWDGAAGVVVTATMIPVTDTYYHICGVFYASNNRAVLVNGANKSTDNTNVVVSGIDRATIGVSADSTPVFYMSGLVAEAACWNAALNDNEIFRLSRGDSPFEIRPRNLFFYYPFVGRTMTGDVDFGLRRLHMTAYNAPTWAIHPPSVRNGLIFPSWRLDGLNWNAFWGEVAAVRQPRPPAAYNTLAIY